MPLERILKSWNSLKKAIWNRAAIYAVIVPFSLRQGKRRWNKALESITFDQIARIGLGASILSPNIVYAVQSETAGSQNSQIPQEAKQQVDELAGYNDSLVASPELGYVIQIENETDINLLNNMLSSSGNTEIKQIGGVGHKNLSIINNTNASENQETIKALKNYSQVRYTAPLFSANGETLAVIPEIVARVKNEGDYSKLEELCSSSNLRIKNKLDFTKKEYLIEVLGNDANAVFESVRMLNNSVYIEWASPNLAFQPKLCNEQNEQAEQFLPNDELFPRQWHLNNTGQSGGTPNADINAPEAWAVLGGGGDPNITIAILDTGVDYNHSDLFDNIWVNKNIVQDINLDGRIDIHDLDLDGNRFIDENELNQYGENQGVIGWDFYDNDNSPYPSLEPPSNTHGTAVAGIAAAKGNNRIGVTGVAYDCKIMPVRMANINNQGQTSFSTVSDLATAIRFAAENGADVINCSWNSMGSDILHSAIVDVATQGRIGRKGKGCIVSAASGNSDDPYYANILFPARYPEVIAVGAVDHNGTPYYYSVRGPELELVAPSGDVNWNGNLWTTDIVGGEGVNLYPNISSDYTNKMGGTSGACPLVSGVAALVLSRNLDLTNDEVRNILFKSAKNLITPNWDEFSGAGYVSAYTAVKMALNPPENLIFVDDDAPNDPGPGKPYVRDPLEDGSAEHPFDSIQEGINNITNGGRVIVLPGEYTWNGNYNIDFFGKRITIQSRDGPENCIIDCKQLGRGFHFNSGEGKDSIVKGFTIKNGKAYSGAGISCSKSEPTISNCIFLHNSAQGYGGGLYDSQGNSTLINCTFIENSAGENGGAITNHMNNKTKVINCIFRNNAPEDLYSLFEGVTEVSYSCIQGGWPGEGNIDKDPLFADPNNNNYYLKSKVGRCDPKTGKWVRDDVTSPCIDAGNPGSSLEEELLGIPGANYEVHNLRINMGAHGGTAKASFPEDNWTLPADLTNNGRVDFEDFAVFSKYWRKTGKDIPADLNRDGKVDAADLSYFTVYWLKESEQYNKE